MSVMSAVPAPTQRRLARGLTAIEILVAIVVLAILAAVAFPSFQGTLDKHKLRGVADGLVGDLEFARMEAVRTNKEVFVSFTTGSNWCYGMNLTSACNCSTPNACNVKQVSYAEHPQVTLETEAQTTPAAASFDPVFDPSRGMSSAAGYIVLKSQLAKQAKVSLSALGTASVCTPNTSTGSAGYPPC